MYNNIKNGLKNNIKYTCIKYLDNRYYTPEYNLYGKIINLNYNKKYIPVKVIIDDNQVIFDASLNKIENKYAIKKNKQFEYANKKLKHVIYSNDISDNDIINDIKYLYIDNSLESYGDYRYIIKHIIKGKWKIDFGLKDINSSLSNYEWTIDTINDSLLEIYNLAEFINKRIQLSVLSILEDNRTINIEIEHLQTYKILYGRDYNDCYLCIIDIIIDSSIYQGMNSNDFTKYLYKKVHFLKEYLDNLIKNKNDEYLFTYYIFKVTFLHNNNLLSNCFDDILYIFYCEEIDLITENSILKLRNDIKKYGNTIFYNKINNLIKHLDIT